MRRRVFTGMSRSVRVYLGLMAYLALVKVLISAFPDAFRSTAQAKVFAWPFLAIVTAVGLLGVWLCPRAGLPEVWDPQVPLRRRLWVPAGLGLALGVLAIVVDAATHWTRTVASAMQLPSIHIDFPMSLPIYPGGAIIVNVLYYLLPIPLLVWLVGKLRRRASGRGVFWAVAALAAAIEPLTQDLHFPGNPAVGALVLIEDYALNLAQVWMLGRAGFGATVVLRVAFYLVWHVLWGLA